MRSSGNLLAINSLKNYI